MFDGSQLEVAEQRFATVCAVQTELVSDTTWPATKHGVAVQVYGMDVAQFCEAVRSEYQADRFSVCMALFRPLRERSEFMLAAAIDGDFARQQIDFIENHKGEPLGGRNLSQSAAGRARNGEARGVIARWERDTALSDDGSTSLDARIGLQGLGSALTHPNLMSPARSRVIAASPKERVDFIRLAHGVVLTALGETVASIQLVGAIPTDAWLRAREIILDDDLVR